MKNLKYKVMMGYADYIPIDETELEKALTAFVTDQGAVFKNGAVSRISGILPDYHAMMGWNPGYKLQPEDYREIRESSECNQANRMLEATKNTIEGKRNQALGTSPQAKELSHGMTA